MLVVRKFLNSDIAFSTNVFLLAIVDLGYYWVYSQEAPLARTSCMQNRQIQQTAFRLPNTNKSNIAASLLSNVWYWVLIAAQIATFTLISCNSRRAVCRAAALNTSQFRPVGGGETGSNFCPSCTPLLNNPSGFPLKRTVWQEYIDLAI